jgi:hypothetical protein
MRCSKQFFVSIIFLTVDAKIGGEVPGGLPFARGQSLTHKLASTEASLESRADIT